MSNKCLILRNLSEKISVRKFVSYRNWNLQWNKQIEWFLGMLLGTLGASLLGNLLQANAQLEQMKGQLELIRQLDN